MADRLLSLRITVSSFPTRNIDFQNRQSDVLDAETAGRVRVVVIYLLGLPADQRRGQRLGVRRRASTTVRRWKTKRQKAA